VLLDLLLGHSYSVTLRQSGLVHAFSPAALVAALLR
jgi:hypothetical protein